MPRIPDIRRPVLPQILRRISRLVRRDDIDLRILIARVEIRQGVDVQRRGFRFAC